MSLPIFQSAVKELGLLQTSWASALNPVIANPLSLGLVLQGVSLKIGANVINHRLGRKLQGYVIVRQRAASSIYDTQDANNTPALTLNLNASAAVVVDIFVF